MFTQLTAAARPALRFRAMAAMTRPAMGRVAPAMARAYSHGLDPSEPADYDAYVAQWRSHFQKCDENFELERGLNHIFAEDWVPSVEVIEDAIKASRRLNTWATAVRVLEALEDKVPKRAQYDQYLAHLQPLLEDLGVEEAKTLGTFEPIREKRWIDRD